MEKKVPVLNQWGIILSLGLKLVWRGNSVGFRFWWWWWWKWWWEIQKI